MTDKSLKCLNALLVVTTVYLGAGLVYRLTSFRFEDASISAINALSGPTPPARPHRPLSYYQPIIDRDLLNTTSPGNAVSDRIDITALKKTDLNLKLLGTVTVDGDRRYAVIEKISGSHQQLYHEGGKVQNAVIKRILRGKVYRRKTL